MACLGAQQLEALLRSRVTPQEEAELTFHLEGCIDCRQRLDALAGGAHLIPSPSGGTEVKPSPSSPKLAQAMEALRRIQPKLHPEPKAHDPSKQATTVKEPKAAGESFAAAPRHSPSVNPPLTTEHRCDVTPWWRKRFAGSGLCVLLGAVCLAVDVEPQETLRALSYDLPLRLRGQIRPNEVLIVSMDRDLQRQLNPEHTNQWSRAVHARMLRHALALGAKLIVFDITFAKPRDAAVEDRQFTEALRDSPGKVLLAAELTEREEGGNLLHWVPQLPIEPFLGLSAWGLATVEKDHDGRVRRHYVAANNSHPSLAWKAAELVGQAPADAWRPRWMNYYGGRNTLPFIPYDRFLEQAATDTNLLADRILFVGWNPVTPDGTDEHTNSFTRGPEDTITGVQVHATAFLNLVRREWLEELAWPLEYLLVVCLGVGFSMTFSRLRLRWALACSVAGFLLLLLGACWLTWFKHRWFPWLIVGVVQMPFALLWSILAKRGLSNAPTLQRSNASASAENQPARPAVEPRRLPEIPDHLPLRCVGRGAYGEVWLARDVIGSFHAVKVIYRNTFTHDGPFEREFRGIQKFTPISRLHPGWVHILHVGRNDAQGYFYYVMELGDDETSGQQIEPAHYVPKTLSGELRRRGPLPLEECVSLGVALADALEHFHKHGLIHRDIKPSNVIFGRGAPKFTDIGLVTHASSEGDISWVGTEGFMAPEGPGTAAADVFGLGKLIYEAASGRNCEEFPKMPTALFEEPPTAEEEQFHRVLVKACEDNPAKRYATASELHRDLVQLLNRIKGGLGAPN